MKKVLCLLMTMVLLLTVVPVSVFADYDLTITQQPKTSYTKMGEVAKATVDADGKGITFQWYIKNAGSDRYAKSSVTSATYSARMSDTVKDRLVYCVVTDTYGKTVKSETVRLRLAATVTGQTDSGVVKSGETFTVNISAVGDGLTYKWYFKDKGAAAFKQTSSFTGPSYYVAMNEARNGRQVYCVVTDKYGKTDKSDVVTLQMGVPLKITTQPKTTYTMLGAVAKTTVKAEGEGLTYHWYKKAVREGEDPGDYSYTAMPNLTGYHAYSCDSVRHYVLYIKCVVTDSAGATDYVVFKLYYAGD